MCHRRVEIVSNELGSGSGTGGGSEGVMWACISVESLFIQVGIAAEVALSFDLIYIDFTMDIAGQPNAFILSKYLSMKRRCQLIMDFEVKEKTIINKNRFDFRFMKT